MYEDSAAALQNLPDAAADTLALSRVGLERECLRVDPEGHIAASPHPAGLGSALTHPYITTDFSEALLEFITPPFTDSRETLEFLDMLHSFTCPHLGDELLWAASMPCMVSGEAGVPIADYGRSNVGRMKHVYRQGLSRRYGRIMQAIAGIHFNYSLPQEFWEALYPEFDHHGLRDAVSARYFGCVRNFLRYGWLVSYLFGGSPAICKSFLQGATAGFESLDPGTLYLPHATSLRMSDIGYKNNAQDNLNINYDGIESYVESLTRAIHQHHQPYADIGIKSGDDYLQLNANILQIENEFYSFIRPKQITRSGERPTLALARRGVSYVEMRALDLNPFAPAGVFPEQLFFLEGLLLFCTLESSPAITAKEQQQLNRNQSQVACCGRDPNLTLELHGHRATVREHARAILGAMEPVMGLLDRARDGDRYSMALAAQNRAIDSGDLLSERIIDALRQRQVPFFRLAMDLSAQHREYFLERPLDPSQLQMFDEEARRSRSQQEIIENSDRISFDAYLQRYFKQDPDSRELL